MIREVIVVEGKDDILAVKSAVDAEVIATGGFAYKKGFFRTLKKIAEKKGIIVLTDPDYAGEQIRKDISKYIPNCKHAFLPQKDAIAKSDGDIGVENASPEDIRKALEKARPIMEERRESFTKSELLALGFIGSSKSREKRAEMGQILGIGYCNSKQFLSRLNNFGISREEFERALERMED